MDFGAAYDPKVADETWESGPHWKLWMFDLEKNRASAVEGIDVALGSGAQFAVLEGRTFVFVPFDDWGRTRVYEIDAAGRATARFETSGDVFKWVRAGDRAGGRGGGRPSAASFHRRSIVEAPVSRRRTALPLSGPAGAQGHVGAPSGPVGSRRRPKNAGCW